MQKQLQGVDDNEKWIHLTLFHKKKKLSSAFLFCKLCQLNPSLTALNPLDVNPTRGGGTGEGGRANPVAYN